jgi:hypothetical protein
MACGPPTVRLSLDPQQREESLPGNLRLREHARGRLLEIYRTPGALSFGPRARPAPLRSLDSLELGVDLCTVAGVAPPGLLPHRGPVRGGQSRSARCADSAAPARVRPAHPPRAAVTPTSTSPSTPAAGAQLSSRAASASWACRRGGAGIAPA